MDKTWKQLLSAGDTEGTVDFIGGKLAIGGSDITDTWYVQIELPNGEFISVGTLTLADPYRVYDLPTARVRVIRGSTSTEDDVAIFYAVVPQSIGEAYR